VSDQPGPTVGDAAVVGMAALSVSRFEIASRRLTGSVRRQVEALLRQLQAGELSYQQFVLEAVTAIVQAQARAAAIGDLGMAALLSRQLGRLVAPVGLGPTRADPGRMRRALRTWWVAVPVTVGLWESRQARLTRLAEAETAAQLQDTMQQAMVRQGVRGWVRATDVEPCPLCTELADGKVRPVTVKMARHEGCRCWPQPATLREERPQTGGLAEELEASLQRALAT
jgi:hypothetical protein